jgi:hypothetical protein
MESSFERLLNDFVLQGYHYGLNLLRFIMARLRQEKPFMALSRVNHCASERHEWRGYARKSGITLCLLIMARVRPKFNVASRY